MKILLLGKNGQIGWELQRILAPFADITALGRQELDLTDELAIRSILRSIRPSLIVNAAGYTAVDNAELESDLSMLVNGIAPGILAEEAAMTKALLIHYSTDYVFDGTKLTPYTEVDVPNPINTYGKTKLAGEQVIIDSGCRHLILRTSWVYGLRGNNFFNTILQLSAESNELSVVNDQRGSPTWCRTVAEVTAQIIAAESAKKTIEGTYHLTSSGQTTWYGFAAAIINHATAKGLLKNKPAIKSILTENYHKAAQRPKNSLLDSTALSSVLGIELPDWAASLSLVFSELVTL